MFYIEDDIIYITRGDDAWLEITEILDGAGAQYAMQAYDQLTLSVRAAPSDSSALLFASTGVPGSNRITIPSSATAAWIPGRYSADIQLTTQDGHRFTVWPQLEGSRRYRSSNMKNFIIMPEVTFT